MKIAIPREIGEGERRVAIVPDVAKRLVADGHAVSVQSGAGAEAGFPDDAYAAVGVAIETDTAALWGNAELVLKIHMPETVPDESDALRDGAALVGQLQPMAHLDAVRRLADRGVTSFSLDALPRITRAQSMDVLSSMSTVSGYKAVLLAAAHLGKFFPMLVTAAGTIAPSKILILGAGVAGLQAIATARRLGAVVQAFDVRPAVKEQVESLGAQFLEAEAVEADAEDAGGYAKALSAEQHQKELELIHKHITGNDVCVTTALIPGRPAPELITEAMVRDMQPGSVIVDLAAEAGGNCALTKAGETVTAHGVSIIGPRNLPASMPTHASQMFSKNVATFVNHLMTDGALHLDFDDEITAGTCITHQREIRHEGTRNAIEGGSGS